MCLYFISLCLVAHNMQQAFLRLPDGFKTVAAHVSRSQLQYSEWRPGLCTKGRPTTSKCVTDKLATVVGVNWWERTINSLSLLLVSKFQFLIIYYLVTAYCYHYNFVYFQVIEVENNVQFRWNYNSLFIVSQLYVPLVEIPVEHNTSVNKLGHCNVRLIDNETRSVWVERKRKACGSK